MTLRNHCNQVLSTSSSQVFEEYLKQWSYYKFVSENIFKEKLVSISKTFLRLKEEEAFILALKDKDLIDLLRCIVHLFPPVLNELYKHTNFNSLLHAFFVLIWYDLK
jgi:hypothetical protein